jgi:hypothetical protein
MDDEFGNDLEGDGRDVIKELSHHVSGGTEESNEDFSQDRQCLDGDSNRTHTVKSLRGLPLRQFVH